MGWQSCLAWEFFTDASGAMGCGAHWMQLKWSQLKGSSSGKFGDLPITQKEVFPVVLACAVWGREWNKRQVVVHCDNEAAVVVLNSRDPHIMHLLRALFFIKAFLAAIRYSQIAVGLGDPQMADWPKLSYVVKEMKKKTSGRTKRPRLPITPPIMQCLLEVWERRSMVRC